jgi:hypothetical protein
MPRKTKVAATAAKELPSIPPELIDQFVKGPMSAEAVQAALMAFKKALIERALGAELGHHLGYSPGAERPEDISNHRNGRSAKTVLTEDGALRLQIPRDRDGRFAPILIPKQDALAARSGPDRIFIFLLELCPRSPTLGTMIAACSRLDSSAFNSLRSKKLD